MDDDISEYIIQCINKSLEILGENARFRVIHSLRSRFGITIDQVLEKPEIFSQALEIILGHSAALTIESIIIKCINNKLNLPSDIKNLKDVIKFLYKNNKNI
jgi:hypothetical protein